MNMDMGTEMDIAKMNEKIDKIVDLIRRGYHRNYILNKVKNSQLFEIAKCRIKAREKYGELANKLFFDENGLRYSTPPIIAEYRAKRLKDDVIADISCGVGLQLIYFAMVAKEAIGIEIDRTRAKLAKLNALAMGIKNVKIIRGDALDKKIFKKIDADCIFSDPSRKEEGERKFENLYPNPAKVYEIYKKITNKIAFELPPYIPKKEIKLEGEKEYTSLNFRLNRLALYTNELAECDLSAISLPSMEKITDLDEKIKLEIDKNGIGDFLYEVDNTIIVAGLLENLAGKLSFNGKILQHDKRRTLLTSSDNYKSSFLKKYEIAEVCDFEILKINRILKKLNAKKATLRFYIKPEKYWNLRNEIEKGLDGEEHYYIFKINEKAIIGKLVDAPAGI